MSTLKRKADTNSQDTTLLESSRNTPGTDISLKEFLSALPNVESSEPQLSFRKRKTLKREADQDNTLVESSQDCSGSVMSLMELRSALPNIDVKLACSNTTCRICPTRRQAIQSRQSNSSEISQHKRLHKELVAEDDITVAFSEFSLSKESIDILTESAKVKKRSVRSLKKEAAIAEKKRAVAEALTAKKKRSVAERVKAKKERSVAERVKAKKERSVAERVKARKERSVAETVEAKKKRAEILKSEERLLLIFERLNKDKRLFAERVKEEKGLKIKRRQCVSPTPSFKERYLRDYCQYFEYVNNPSKSITDILEKGNIFVTQRIKDFSPSV